MTFSICLSRQHKDLALVSLANILHRSKYSLDAAILMHAALETTSDYDIVYFTLGNIYGVRVYINGIYVYNLNSSNDYQISIITLLVDFKHMSNEVR